MGVRRRLHLTDGQQARISWLLEICLVGFVFIGFDRGNVGIIVNSLLGLAITQLPPLLERDQNVVMDPGLTLWITAAVFFHALGTVGVTASGASFYQSLWWWDHLTHVLSSSIVAGTGYAFVRAIEEHAEGVAFSREFVFAFILLVVLAFGVLWEVIEFGVGGLGSILGSAAVLTQYGLDDTMMDLVFDALGGLIVAAWGTAYLSGAGDVVAATLFGEPR